MGRKSKVFDDLKIEVIENYLNGIKASIIKKLLKFKEFYR